ncbi:MAG: tetraacyldisaccharide 4'-kinase [Dongiaceae bacterium]
MRPPEFWDRGPGHPLALAAAPLALAYRLGGALRQALARPAPPPLPVLCVGALTAGGAGKTPTVLALAARLQAAGRTVHLVSRGYGGREIGPLRIDPARHDAAAVGDEPLLLAAAAPCWVARDRPAGIRAAAVAGAGIVLLDDGFQNPTIGRSRSLLVIDGAQGFGNGRILPAGPLREPPARGLARADAVLLIGPDRHAIAARLPPGLPLFRAELVLQLPADLARRPLLAFAGIGRPEKFFAALEAAGATVAGRARFPDHHPYTEAEIAALAAQARRSGSALVTTDKDLVRVPAALRAEVRAVPVALTWIDPAAIDRWLR